MFSKMLVGVDGSDCSRHAFETAADMARTLGAKLVILCVVQPPMVIGQRRETAAKFTSILEREARLILADYAEESELRGVKAKTLLSKGHPAKAILSAAKAQRADLIVVGSRGRGGAKKLFLGSVSSAVVQNSNVPVLVTR